ncbi:Uncharacterised protein [Mycoplasmopsis californica]|uniref:Lipoprotein n=1 Tax=Mycoplasmopsis equigenitalium TaxID=114883 RepID=A0ABY5J1J2_9BACT|nr:hypothetical protein [Mycoplasmopsis equigenitalium]UUD37127.1 hypothetical protein NPA09_00940 [Mycoplasmopsis equigenitalium]VEU69567.1 Uncharacterised protein [Mycoplasmopsis californica]
MSLKKYRHLIWGSTGLVLCASLFATSCNKEAESKILRMNEFRGKRVINNLKIGIIGSKINFYTNYEVIPVSTENKSQILLSDIVPKKVLENNYLLEIVNPQNSLFLSILSRKTPANVDYLEYIKYDAQYEVINVDKKYDLNNKLISIKFKIKLTTFVFTNDHKKYFIETTKDQQFISNNPNEFEKTKIYYDKNAMNFEDLELNTLLKPGQNVANFDENTRKQLCIVYFLEKKAKQNFYILINKKAIDINEIDVKNNLPILEAEYI